MSKRQAAPDQQKTHSHWQGIIGVIFLPVYVGGALIAHYGYGVLWPGIICLGVLSLLFFSWLFHESDDRGAGDGSGGETGGCCGGGGGDGGCC